MYVFGLRPPTSEGGEVTLQIIEEMVIEFEEDQVTVLQINETITEN